MYSDWPLYRVYDQFSGGMWKLTDEQKKELKKIKEGDDMKPRISTTQENCKYNALVAGIVSDKIDSLEEQIKDLKNQNETLQTEKGELVKKSEEMQNNINRYTYMDELMDDLEKGYQDDTTQLIQHYEKKLAEEKEYRIKDLTEEKEHHAKEIRSRCDKNEKKIKMFREMIHRLKVAHPDIEELKLMTLKLTVSVF
ncbi:hypothetical protein EIN_281630 [Entamoeba invadens IP1]|uniref:Uncharacterized protein n=1 Tax=Entamoeba invadens IP1 TaxID=370355 RepID=A0A0A1TX19_ENTIV|nr:hypothetical protein EIN_281630 [Entamoeba invadens IP1]ELP85792.1 hypothetical protein EIN_281630 [Entamoeba invadens IP1]|eukprot:XP_004185138.1 hypothetical protein EIN_281630 [Entamoeba invadens IP1]